MKRLVLLLLVLLACGAVRAQQPQTNNPPAPIYATNAKYVQGAGPGYWPTPGSGLTLNLSGGRTRCGNTMTNYAAGTLTMANNTTNYVYLDTGASCAPASNTSGYTSGLINIATVVTSGGIITTITDDRVFGIENKVGGALGTVTSVAQTVPSWLAVAGSPITTSGTLAITPATGQTSHQVIGTCGSATTFTPCSLVGGDLPNPSASTLGGVESFSPVTHQFITDISTSGVPHAAQPACAYLSDAAASCNTDATNATNIGSGTLNAARLPSTAKIRGIPFTIGDPAGAALTVAATTTDYFTVPLACTISAYNLVILPSGTITVKFWKVGTGTAAPTSGNSISTSGVGISTGNAIHSATVTDFTTTTVTANDIMAMNVTAVTTASYVQGVLECDQ